MGLVLLFCNEIENSFNPFSVKVSTTWLLLLFQKLAIPETISVYRLISLCNTIYKIISFFLIVCGWSFRELLIHSKMPSFHNALFMTIFRLLMKLWINLSTGEIRNRIWLLNWTWRKLMIILNGPFNGKLFVNLGSMSNGLLGLKNLWL